MTLLSFWRIGHFNSVRRVLAIVLDPDMSGYTVMSPFRCSISNLASYRSIKNVKSPSSETHKFPDGLELFVIILCLHFSFIPCYRYFCLTCCVVAA